MIIILYILLLLLLCYIIITIIIIILYIIVIIIYIYYCYYYYYFIYIIVIIIIVIILYIIVIIIMCVCLFPKLLHETRPLSIFALEIPLESHVAARRSRAVGKGLPSARKLGWAKGRMVVISKDMGMGQYL